MLVWSSVKIYQARVVIVVCCVLGRPLGLHFRDFRAVQCSYEQDQTHYALELETVYLNIHISTESPISKERGHAIQRIGHSSSTR